MRKAAVVVLLVVTLGLCANVGTIVYSYDEQHRLAGANYNNQALKYSADAQTSGHATVENVR